MPSDVSGTIHIIAEVMGAGSQQPGAAGQIVPASNPADGNKKWGWLKTIGSNMKTIAKIVGVAGILTQSKILTQTFSAMARIIGALVDVILAPLMPLFIRGLNVLSKVVGFVQTFLDSPLQAFKDVWSGLVDWFTTTWEEKGGFWGVLKDATLNITGALLVAALFGKVTGLLPVDWVIKKVWGITGGPLLTRAKLGARLGFTKLLNWAAPGRPGRTAGWKKNLKYIFLGTGRLLKRLFGGVRTLFSKDFVRAAFNLTKSAMGFFAKPLGRVAWRAILFGQTTLVNSIAALGRLLAIPATLGMTAAGMLTAGIIIAGITAVAALSIILSWAVRQSDDYIRTLPGGDFAMDAVWADADRNITPLGTLIWSDNEIADLKKISKAFMGLFGSGP